jgi:hypothetical protein
MSSMHYHVVEEDDYYHNDVHVLQPTPPPLPCNRFWHTFRSMMSSMHYRVVEEDDYYHNDVHVPESRQ